ncbi:hypothetical protein [Streptomyces cinereoruber]|uniref:hypothetical protein n=1 Tax=Streptomyces cinereoruber TaxID=67260 RepID=UPI00363DDDE3
MARIDRAPGIPRWVGARARVHRKLTNEGVSPLLVTITVPPVRGFLYGLWLQCTKRSLPRPREL